MNRILRIIISATSMLFMVSYSVIAQVPAEDPFIGRVWGTDRSITQISDSVYRWGADGQYGAYILTKEGIIVVDGHYCPSGAVDWLKSELDKRHDVPVKYVILSHDHPDHVCNSDLFGDTAVAVAHKNLREHIIRDKRPSLVPEITFEDSMDLHLGGIKVSLLYFGPSHSDNLIQIHVPQEKVLIAIDFAKGKSLFPDYRDMDVKNALKVMKILSKLDDVDVVLPGHGPIMDQDNFMESYRYIKALYDEVLDLMVAGKSLAEIRKLITMDEFRDYAGIDRFLDSNIVTMYDNLYHYREPNIRISDKEAVKCIEDSRKCRTSDNE